MRDRHILECALLALACACSSNDNPGDSAAAGAGGVAGSIAIPDASSGTSGQAGSKATGGSGGLPADASGDAMVDARGDTTSVAPCLNDPNLPLVDMPPAKLSETGLYGADGKLASYVQEYAPQFALWSDGADKVRWVYVPSCRKIDTSDMDHWSFPIGTRVWKQFAVNGKIIETRLIHRYGPGPDDWIFAAYQWNDAGTDADYVGDGVINAKGTQHDIPSNVDCSKCHSKLPEHLLGLSAIQLSHTGAGVTIRSLSDAGKLTVPAPNGFAVPGSDPATQTALGYLHANCGNCHNSSFVTVDLHLRLLVGQKSVATTDAYASTVGKPTTNTADGGNLRIDAGHPTMSTVVLRMTSRVSSAQMPPIASKVVDTTGVQTVSAWITALGTGDGGL